MNTPINTCGLSCPQPVLLVLEYITKNAPNIVEVMGDNDASRENISRAAHNRGYEVTPEAGAHKGVWQLRLTKNGFLEEGKPPHDASP